MSRLMFDSTKAADIPQGSALVAGYVDGSCAWAPADFDRFPGRTVVRIAIFNDRFDAQVLDCEPGDNDARGAVPWIKGKWDRGQTPTVYCFTDGGPIGYDISEVRAACDAAGVKRPQFWIAQWDGNPGTFDPRGDPSIVAKQYAGSAITGGHYDASIVADNWPGVDIVTTFTPEQQAAYDLVAPIIQDRVVAPQHDTNIWFANALAAVAADDKAALAAALTKVGQALERSALLLDASAATK